MIAARPVDSSGYAAVVAPSSYGRPPRLEWLAVDQLVIDPAYQREITRLGRTNVRSIAAAFNWSMFTPVVVAPAGSNRFAIVDGQHRTTAAAICGIERVPCAIIEAAPGEQAAAFRAINGNVTRMHTLHLFHAAVAAGEEDAAQLAELCAKAGVTIVRNPTQADRLKPRETCVVSAIARSAKRFGSPITVRALKTICDANPHTSGLLQQRIIWGVTEVLADHKEWLADPARLVRAFEGIDLEEMIAKAAAAAARMRGTSAVDQFEGLLVEALDAAFKKGRAA